MIWIGRSAVPERMIDDLDRHLAAAGSLDRAAKPPGMFLAWCGNLQLLSVAFQQAHESALLRLRFRDMSPAEFFTSSTGGSIDPADLSADGRAFADAYYPAYLDDLEALFGADIYGIEDDWAHYDRIAAVLTRHFMAWKGASEPEREAVFGAREAGKGRKWWRRWRS